MWIRGNHKPQIRGTDDGIWRRVLLVPFTVQIPPEEVDPELPQKLRDEMPGILAWAVRGCIEWQRDGLNPPGSVLAAVDEYRAEMDTLGGFIEERCSTAPHAEATASELYQAYRKWCDDHGEQPVSQRRFGTSLAERGFVKEKRGTVRWRGIGLLSDRCPRCAGEGCSWCE